MVGKRCCLDFQHCLDGCLNGAPHRYCQIATAPERNSCSVVGGPRGRQEALLGPATSGRQWSRVAASDRGRCPTNLSDLGAPKPPRGQRTETARRSRTRGCRCGLGRDPERISPRPASDRKMRSSRYSRPGMERARGLVSSSTRYWGIRNANSIRNEMRLHLSSAGVQDRGGHSTQPSALTLRHSIR